MLKRERSIAVQARGKVKNVQTDSEVILKQPI